MTGWNGVKTNEPWVVQFWRRKSLLAMEGPAPSGPQMAGQSPCRRIPVEVDGGLPLSAARTEPGPPEKMRLEADRILKRPYLNAFRIRHPCRRISFVTREHREHVALFG